MHPITLEVSGWTTSFPPLLHMPTPPEVDPDAPAPDIDPDPPLPEDDPDWPDLPHPPAGDSPPPPQPPQRVLH
ncbi:hypothetical protein [Paraburkholderia phosphatilytica]|uniref:hypothetical protein n=1 Tax=Paraburkholderia phosphatilytica TaxID=2282883 RepID=UPI000E553860|nr:hypothetical protein [Paraburkholderia phosphatilytica]